MAVSKIPQKKMRSTKICVECGRVFECPPSDKTVTCSQVCRSTHARKRQMGRRLSAETRKKIADKAKNRDMSDLQKIGTEAAKNSPKSGRFETNVNAGDWHIISPEGAHYRFHSLNFWMREHCREFFGCEPDGREYRNACSGLRQAKRATLGRVSENQRPCCTYKGWRVVVDDE